MQTPRNSTIEGRILFDLARHYEKTQDPNIIGAIRIINGASRKPFWSKMWTVLTKEII